MEEEIRQYGDLSDRELLSLLNEIRSEDEGILEAQLEAEGEIALEEESAGPAGKDNTEPAEESSTEPAGEKEAELSEEEIENRRIEAQYGSTMPWMGTGPNYCRGVRLFGPEGQRKLIQARKKSSQNLKIDRVRIQRMAFDQDKIPLSDPIGNENIKLLISLLVKEHTKMIDKYSAYINKRLALLLDPLIPRRLRACKKAYPDSVKVSPGFLYTASEKYGAGLTFWATPDVAYYFPQGTEQKVLAEHKCAWLVGIDQSVKCYHEHIKKRTDKELSYASTIYRKGVYTYFDLLRLNPFWYEKLYNDLILKLENYERQLEGGTAKNPDLPE